MQTITTIGLDIAKSVFQVHGVDNDGKVVIRRQLKRRYVLAFFESCSPAWSASRPVPRQHHWSRELQALGHTVRLMPLRPTSKPYVKRQKNDAWPTQRRTSVRRSQEPICGLCQSRRPSNKSGLMLHRTRHLFIRQQTSVINAIRAHLAEFGVTAARSGAKASRNYCGSSPIRATNVVPDVKVRAWSCRTGQPIAQSKKADLGF